MIWLEPGDRLRLQRGAEHLSLLGPRATAEFLAELAKRNGCARQMLDLLSEYRQRLSVDAVRLAGADRFPQIPLRQVA